MKTERKTRAAGGFRPAAEQTAPCLAFHSRRRRAFNQLPFIDEHGLSGWDVPASGGFFGGQRTGEALAVMFLKHLREHGGKDRQSLELLAVVRGMVDRYEQEGGRAMCNRRLSQRSEGFNTLNGQMVGFMGVVGNWLVAAAQHMGTSLDDIDNQALLTKANAGLSVDGGEHENS